MCERTLVWQRHCAVVTDRELYTYGKPPRKHTGLLTKETIFSLFAHCHTPGIDSPFRVYRIRVPPADEVARSQAGGVMSYSGMASKPKWATLRDAVLALQGEA